LRSYLLPFAALLVAGSVMASTFGEPFTRSWLGHNGARYAHFARNYHRLDWSETLGVARAEPAGRVDPARPDAYVHHPPGVPLLVALVGSLLPSLSEEDAARLVPALSTLLALLLLARLVSGCSDARAGGMAALVAAGMPMVSVYGAHVDPQGPPVVVATLLVLGAYRRWLDGQGGMAAVLAASVLASFFDWYGLYAPVGCAAHLAWTRPAQRRTALALAAFALGLFGAWVVALLAASGKPPGTLVTAAGVRVVSAFAAEGAPVGRHLAEWWNEVRVLVPLVVLALPAALGVALGWRPGRSPIRDRGLGPRGLVALLVLPPLVHGALFPAGLVVHGYWLFALPYGLAAALALLLRELPTPLALVLVLAYVGLGTWLAVERVLPARDGMPAAVGEALARHVPVGEAVLTNYDCNPLVPGREDDAYLLTRPEVTFYADRAVRGMVRDPAALAAARERVPDAGWFLELGWIPSPGLREALARHADEPPLTLPENEEARLYRLER